MARSADEPGTVVISHYTPCSVYRGKSRKTPLERNQCSAGNEETVQTEYIEVECLYYRVLAEPDTREKG